MYRIDDATAATSLPAPEAAGTEGYFTEGNPATGTPATKVRGSWLNMIQEELRAIVVAAGLTPSKTTYTQVRDAIKALVPANAPGRLLGAPQVFTNSGTYTRNPLATLVIFEVQGGGAGTGGAPATSSGQFSGSPGASSGAYAKVALTAAQIGTSQAITVGAAGTAGAAGSSNGGNGGTTSVGSLIICPGGVGSSSYGPTGSTFVANAPSAYAALPTISAGTVLLQNRGNQGGAAFGGVGVSVIAGAGAVSPIQGASSGSGAGAGGTANGASASAQTGFSGNSGQVTIWEFA
jgi:hypothetical protein